MSGMPRAWACCGLATAAIFLPSPPCAVGSNPVPPSLPLFNGKDLTGWINVNGASEMWLVRDASLVCRDGPRSFLRTETRYDNYVLELEWRLVAKGGEARLLVHAEALPAVGAPYPRAIAIPIQAGDHGSIVGFEGGTLTPLTRPGGSNRAQPLEDRCRPAGAWNHYQLTSRDTVLELAVNGKVVTRVKDCRPGHGYIGLASKEGEVHFRYFRLTPLPGPHPPAKPITQGDESFRSLFDGASFAGWQHRAEYQGHWKARDGVIQCDGKLPVPRRQDRDLWTVKEYGDFLLVVDWRLPETPEPRLLPAFTPDGLFLRDKDGKVQRREIPDAGDSGVFLRGNTRSQVNIWCQPMGSGDINDYHKDAKLPVAIRQACVPRKKADNLPGQWNRFVITMQGDRVTVVLNGETVIERAQLPGVPTLGRLGLQDHGDPVEFRNLFIKTLD